MEHIVEDREWMVAPILRGGRGLKHVGKLGHHKVGGGWLPSFGVGED